MKNTTHNLKAQISHDIARAIDSCINYTGEEKEQNTHNWVQITTDRAIGAIINSLPEPIDTPTKYEVQPGDTLVLPDTDEESLNYLSKFSGDNGYNRFFYEYLEYLQGLYRLPEGVLQSGHEQVQNGKDRLRQEGVEESTNEERSSRSTNNRSPSGSEQVQRDKGWNDSEEHDESDDKEPSKVR